MSSTPPQKNTWSRIAQLTAVIAVYSLAVWLSIFKNVTWPQTVLGLLIAVISPFTALAAALSHIDHGQRESVFSALKTHPYESATGIVVTLSHVATAIALFSRKQTLLAVSFVFYALAGLPLWAVMSNTA